MRHLNSQAGISKQRYHYPTLPLELIGECGALSLWPYQPAAGFIKDASETGDCYWTMPIHLPAYFLAVCSLLPTLPCRKCATVLLCCFDILVLPRGWVEVRKDQELSHTFLRLDITSSRRRTCKCPLSTFNHQANMI